MSSLGSELVQSMREAVDYARGVGNTDGYVVHLPEDIDVRKIRNRLKMTQKAFAASFGFSLATVRHWEQKVRRPEGPARAYLLVISRSPDVVREALRQGAALGG